MASKTTAKHPRAEWDAAFASVTEPKHGAKGRRRKAVRRIARPPHPGETIREDYLKPLGMSINRLAIELSSPGHPNAGGRKRAARNHG